MTEQYSKAASRVTISCPIVAVLLPSTRSRCEILKSMNGVKHLGADEIAGLTWDFSKDVPKFRSSIQIVYLDLSQMSRGIRPLGVPDHAFRIRVGEDTTIADLVCSLRQQHQHDCVCFDFGGTSSPQSSPQSSILCFLIWLE